MPDPIRLEVPGSKSQTQRALITASLARGESWIHGPLECDDSRHLRRALRLLGVRIVLQESGWRVHGGALEPPGVPLWCGEAGTTLRFLAPLALLLRGPLTLDGSARLRQRPIAAQVSALEQLGARVDFLGQPGAAPLRLACEPAAISDRAEVDCSQSSQFASGLMMVGPCLPRGLRLDLAGAQIVSQPYLEMTQETMAAFGVKAVSSDGRRIDLPPLPYQPGELRVEGDWSSAAFLYAAGYIRGKRVVVGNVSPRSCQGDHAIVGYLERLVATADRDQHVGVADQCTFDLTHCPDLVGALAVACALSPGPSRLVGLAHARLKESDRVAVLCRGLRQAGLHRVEEAPDGLTFRPCRGSAISELRAVRLDPAGDHRMAMAFGLLTLIEPGIQVLDQGCVTKSYPSFWEDLQRLR